MARSLLATASAVLISFALAQPAAARGWQEPVLVAPSDAWGWPLSASLVALDDSTVVAVYSIDNQRDVARVFVRRSVDSGKTWQAPIMLTDHGWRPRIAGHGSNVDVTWNWAGRVMYAQSMDAGISFSVPRAISPASHLASWAVFARGDDGLVAVVWRQGRQLRAIVSRDGGSTFGRPRTVNSGGRNARIAVGAGGIYILTSSADRVDTWPDPAWTSLHLDRSVDGGRSWQRIADWPVEMAESEDGTFALAVEGLTVFVAYQTKWIIRSRISADGGESWSGPRLASPRRWRALTPHAVLHNGVAHATFYAAKPRTGVGGIYYSRAAGGAAWVEPVSVAVGEAETRSIAFAGRPIVLYLSYEEQLAVYARAGPR